MEFTTCNSIEVEEWKQVKCWGTVGREGSRAQHCNSWFERWHFRSRQQRVLFFSLVWNL